MNRIIYLLLLMSLMIPAHAQVSFRAALDSVAVNNKNLAAARLYVESQKISAKTGIYLPDPTVTFDRLNSPSGNYSEMIVSQSFDFPTAYKAKGVIAGTIAQQAAEYARQAKLEVFTETAMIFSEIIGINRKTSIMQMRYDMMARLQENSGKKLSAGESNIFEAGRIRTETAKLKSEMQLLAERHKMAAKKMAVLNGGINVVISDTIYPLLISSMAPDSLLSGIMSNHPAIKMLQSKEKQAEQGVKLQKALSLPKFELGYRHDYNTGIAFNGIHAGVSIPLFENKNTVKASKAGLMYVRSEMDDYALNLRNTVVRLISEYTAIQKSLNEIKTVFESLNTPALLFKAYNAGQINYTEFFSEYGNYFQTATYLEELMQEENKLQLQFYVLVNI